jgi:hypothetical protein
MRMKRPPKGTGKERVVGWAPPTRTSNLEPKIKVVGSRTDGRLTFCKPPKK